MTARNRSGRSGCAAGVRCSTDVFRSNERGGDHADCRGLSRSRNSRSARCRPSRVNSRACSRGSRAPNSTTSGLRRRPSDHDGRPARCPRRCSSNCCRCGLRRRKRPCRRVANRQHVVAVRRIAASVEHFALLADRVFFAELVVVGMQIRDAFGDLDALGVMPRAAADAVAGVDGGFAVRRAGAQIGAPRLAAGAGRSGKLLAVRVGAGQAVKVRALARPLAGQEKSHLLGGRRCGGKPEKRGSRRGEQNPGHVVLLCRRTELRPLGNQRV